MKSSIALLVAVLAGCGGGSGGDDPPIVADPVVQDVSGRYSLTVDAYMITCSDGSSAPVLGTTTTVDVTQNGTVITGFISAASPLVPYEGGIDPSGDFLIARSTTASNGVDILTALDGQFSQSGWFGELTVLTDLCSGRSLFSGDLL